MKTKLWLFTLLLILFHKPATAGVVSGMSADDLMEKCRYADADFKKLNSDQLTDVTACVSYITGVLDGYTVGVTTSGGERTMVCDLPEGVTVKHVALIVLHYARDNPADLHFPASIVTMKAVNKSFPCKGESR